MTIANGAQHALYYVAETSYGVVPSTPTWNRFPHTGTTLNLTKDGIESEKLRGDRQVEDFRHGNRSIGGDVSSELEYAAFDDLLEAALCGTWTTDVLEAGPTRRSFTIEREFADLDTPEYHRYSGCEINTLAMSISPNAMVSTTFTIVGKDIEVATTEVSGSTRNADIGNIPFDSFTGSILEGGSSIAVVTSLELNVENGLEALFSVGAPTTNRPSIGKSRVTGTLTTYFESKSLYEKFINETESSITATLEDPDGNQYTIELPRVKYNSGQPDVSGEGAVTIALEFVALFDDTEETNMRITRTDAV